MIAVLVNGAAILVGGSIGLLLKKGIPEEMGSLIMKGMALCVIYIGISGAFEGENTMVAILSMMIGAILGHLMKLDYRLNQFAQKIERKMKKDDSKDKSTVAEGFVTATLLFCIGAMAIVGSLQAGLAGDYEMLFTKSAMDGISSVIFAATLGLGVLLASVPVVIYQGLIVVIAGFAAPYLSDYIIGEMTCVGSLLIVAIALNMLGITQIKIMNLMPAVLIPILLCQFM
ncbi:MAG: DUF554 domain-containing protein [Clostridia bacterium]|jgi:uncharacterized membrane protein YqgA involved in biofilm formation|nr:DUF554 domain-containing protein [Clostridia bacterium]HPD90645.1 DUF554 domain-containing protein [Bacillota bacterium]